MDANYFYHGGFPSLDDNMDSVPDYLDYFTGPGMPTIDGVGNLAADDYEWNPSTASDGDSDGESDVASDVCHIPRMNKNSERLRTASTGVTTDSAILISSDEDSDEQSDDEMSDASSNKHRSHLLEKKRTRTTNSSIGASSTHTPYVKDSNNGSDMESDEDPIPVRKKRRVVIHNSVADTEVKNVDISSTHKSSITESRHGSNMDSDEDPIPVRKRRTIILDTYLDNESQEHTRLEESLVAQAQAQAISDFDGDALDEDDEDDLADEHVVEEDHDDTMTHEGRVNPPRRSRKMRQVDTAAKEVYINQMKVELDTYRTNSDDTYVVNGPDSTPSDAIIVDFLSAKIDDLASKAIAESSDGTGISARSVVLMRWAIRKILQRCYKTNMTLTLERKLLALTRIGVREGKIVIPEQPILPDHAQISKMAGIYLEYKCENGTQSWDGVLLKMLVVCTMTTFDVKAEDFLWPRQIDKKRPSGLKLKDITLRITRPSAKNRGDNLEGAIRDIQAIVDLTLWKGKNIAGDIQQRRTSVTSVEDHTQFDWITLVLTLGLRMGWFKGKTLEEVIQQALLHERGEIAWRNDALDLPLIPQMYERRILIQRAVHSGLFLSVDAVRELGDAVRIWETKQQDMLTHDDAEPALLEPAFEELDLGESAETVKKSDDRRNKRSEAEAMHVRQTLEEEMGDDLEWTSTSTLFPSDRSGFIRKFSGINTHTLYNAYKWDKWLAKRRSENNWLFERDWIDAPSCFDVNYGRMHRRAARTGESLEDLMKDILRPAGTKGRGKSTWKSTGQFIECKSCDHKTPVTGSGKKAVPKAKQLNVAHYMKEHEQFQPGDSCSRNHAPVTFATLENFHEHIEKSHSYLNQYYCQKVGTDGKYCYEDLTQYRSSKAHYVLDHGEFEAGTCPAGGKPKCETKLSSLEEAVAHMQKKHPKFEARVCPVEGCKSKKLWRNLDTFKGHLAAIHGKGLPDFVEEFGEVV